MQPQIGQIELDFSFQKCPKCGRKLGLDNFVPVTSPFFPNGRSTICAHCLTEYLEEDDFNWERVDRVCQYLGIPFIPNEFEKIKASSAGRYLQVYAEIFMREEYQSLDWGTYFQEFKKLEAADMIDNELPILKEKKREELRQTWGDYSDEDYQYLENLYKGLLKTQSVNGSLQHDQALKLCKISLQIEKKIDEGEAVDKMLASYDKLVNIAGFTPKNTKNANDFESVGELIKWLEKRGFENTFYDGVTRDIVDETIKNMQSYNQRLYTNESGIGDEITSRLEHLKTLQEMEDNFDEKQNYDLDNYDNDGYNSLFIDNDEFNTSMEEANNKGEEK